MQCNALIFLQTLRISTIAKQHIFTSSFKFILRSFHIATKPNVKNSQEQCEKGCAETRGGKSPACPLQKQTINVVSWEVFWAALKCGSCTAFISCWKGNDHFLWNNISFNTVQPPIPRMLRCCPLNTTNKEMTWERRKERENVMGAVCVCVCVEEHQRNTSKVSSHLQLHPFVFPQLLSFLSCLCIYSTQSSSMLAGATSVVFQSHCRFREMKIVPFTSPW